MANVIAFLVITFFCLTMLANVEAVGLPVVNSLSNVVQAAGTSVENILKQVIALVVSLLDVGSNLQVVLDTVVKVLQALLDSSLLK